MDNPFLKEGWEKDYELRSTLSEITNRLKLWDQISLIFLMCKSPEYALITMKLLFKETSHSSRNNLFFNWLMEQNIFQNDSWKILFSEFLTIIQHYQSIKLLGYDKNEMKKKFLPKNNLKADSVSNIRKLLYNICEDLDKEDTRRLIEAMDLKNEIDYHNDDDEKGFKYLEYKFLLWSKYRVINLNPDENINLDALIKVLKSINFSNYVPGIEIIVEQSNINLIRNSIVIKSDFQHSECYPIIKKNNLGYCVIINEKVFTDSKFDTRWGTEKDVERLVEVFSNYGFDIRIHYDLTFDELITTLEFYTRAIDKNHSAFILIILSHGSENVIYTSDSQAVDMNTIEMVFQAEICPNLIGKPKIFIVQSCQGEKWQKMCMENENGNILRDGIIASKQKEEIFMGPQRGDSLIAWSTVQGFASFRDKYNGSWYIQEFCNELWRFGDVADLVEIFTRVNNNLRRKVYENQFMVPSMLLSLRAKVKFPHVEKNKQNAKRKILERIIFENVFEEFLLKNGDLIRLKNLIKK
ncbi:caspase-8, putative [Pediculus humanus corporis]|uniref:Caspase-8, putative n=1 Tax=Pediculus humanus subsp. corporis TaxID=121224 RepID=E0W1C4_PEDHC|nr:caspase-8, putative [Pediculus humanus corporis]EEB19430.1 caspase-8, putative [Pediculus humanus corporis]